MEEAISISISNSDDHSSENRSCSKAAVLLLERKQQQQQQQQQQAKPQKDHQANLNCPRCSSTNTKFCYYNNYSLTQPRYFCKTCRRYWTEGGTLRNVPVGGGSRKNKRSINTTSFSSSLSSSSSFKTTTHLPDLNPPPPPPFLSHFSSQNPIRTTIHESHDLSLAFSLPPQYYHGFPHFAHEFPKINNSSSSSSSSSSSTTTTTTTNSSSSCSSSSSFVPTARMPDSSNSSTIFTSGFPALQEFKVPHLSFSAHLHGVVDHDHHDDDHHHQQQQQQQQNNISTSGRVFFPFGEVKQLPITTTSIGVIGHEFSGNNNNKGPGSSATAAYWNNGMFGSGGGGGSW